MGDYVIWVGEKLEKLYPNKSWEEIMDIVTTCDFPGEYSIEAYLKEVRR